MQFLTLIKNNFIRDKLKSLNWAKSSEGRIQYLYTWRCRSDTETMWTVFFSENLKNNSSTNTMRMVADMIGADSEKKLFCMGTSALLVLRIAIDKIWNFYTVPTA